MAVSTPARGGPPGAAGANGTGFTVVLDATVTTTDGTVTNIGTFTVPQNSVVGYELWITGRDTTASPALGVGYYRSFFGRRDTGNATIIGAGFSGGDTAEDGAITAASCGLTTSTTDIVVQVLGVAATTFNWHAIVYQRVSVP